MNIPYKKDRASLWQRPKLLALVIAVGIALWVLSAVIIPPASPKPQGMNPVDSKNKNIDISNLPISIEVLQAQPRAHSILLNGVTEPERITLVEAETEGKVTKILHEEGQAVEKGETLMKLDERDRRSKLAEAKALLHQRQVELNAAQKLYQKGYTSKVRLSQAQAAVEAARSQVQQAQLDLSYTTITAPYSGIIEEILVEEGDLVGKGFNKQTVMRFVDLSPLKIKGQVSEQERVRIKKGDKAQIRFSTGEEITGTIGFIATVADEDTRTFRVEIEIPNDDRKLQAGVSAEIALQADQEMAYPVSSSVLALNDAGKVGVKVVDDQNTIRFMPVEVLSQSGDGVWISGLPDTVRMVTEGVSFVSDGQVLDDKMLADAIKQVPATKTGEAPQ